MRTLTIAGAALALLAFSTGANAQRLGGHAPATMSGGAMGGNMSGGSGWHGGGGQWHGGTSGGQWQGGNAGGQWHGSNPGGGQWHGGTSGNGGWHPQPGQGGHHSHWGGSTGGHWIGGMHAPGGWGAYRHPTRGWRLPSYWFAPSFFIGDYADYGLGAPPYGYSWSRYYDDAVLVDQGGQIWDSVSGVDWDRDDDSAGYGTSYDGAQGEGSGYADQGSYDQGGYAQQGYGAGYPQPDGNYPHRSNGVGGAVIGGVVGGVAGNVIAGRGNRTAGTLIGAGVGAAGGYAIDRLSNRGRYAPPSGYGAGYGDAPPPRITYAPAREVVEQPGYSTTYYSSGSSAGYVSGGYYYPPATTTTVTIASAPVVTTTTTEYIDEVATRKVWHKPVHKWHPRCNPCSCYCRR